MRSTTVLPGTPCLPPTAGDVPLHRLEVSGPGAVPFAVGTFEAVGPLARASRPHRHTFYEIVHVTAGTGAHVVDFARWPLRPPHLAVIRPGQVHHWEPGGHGPDGTLALFTEDFLLDHPGDRETLRRLGERCWFALDAEADAWTGRLMAELIAEYRQRAAGHEGVLRSLLHVLVVRAARLPVPGRPGAAAEICDAVPAAPAGDGCRPSGGRGGGRSSSGDRTTAGGRAPVGDRTTAGDRAPVADRAPVGDRVVAVAEAFASLVAGREAVGWTVGECAARLGVTPGYLTQAVRAATGRSPGRLLIEARTYQAQQLLAHTQLSVRQIAARTGFADPAYFCRFFRRETGTSPGTFRKHHSRHHQSIEAPGSHA
ncbi:AraC family transcriptional regulator [Streptomyces sp. MMS24-I2-30]|uniref:AraC family transcriptional regulator n=1 Tax=Streptomyces sp. MMS24-I2-30 TaxID=3351564 RepID=UPI003896995A